MIFVQLLKKIFRPRGSDSTGTRGEDEAVKFLKKNGYKVTDRNYSIKAGEVDIIATDGEALVFIEVKTRSSTSHGRASEFVDDKKQRRIIKTAHSYIMKNYSTEEEPEVRFDIVEVYLNDGSFNCELIKDAFQASW